MNGWKEAGCDIIAKLEHSCLTTPSGQVRWAGDTDEWRNKRINEWI